ncbi:MAG TPA: type IX secretion system membrane protein PorP/SprF, partial [Bacteroidia bacterium]|nr:type IX secretion system membrane protein PorP/SprF [Bacteroidia bacterium]
MKKLLLIIALSTGIQVSYAQDLHYSMFTMAPLTLNPALCGNFLGDLRIVNNYRMQWTTIKP